MTWYIKIKTEKFTGLGPEDWCSSWGLLIQYKPGVFRLLLGDGTPYTFGFLGAGDGATGDGVIIDIGEDAICELHNKSKEIK